MMVVAGGLEMHALNPEDMIGQYLCSLGPLLEKPGGASSCFEEWNVNLNVGYCG